LNLTKASVPAAVALLVSGLMFPYPAYAVGRDVGRLTVDCDLGDLERETIVYLEVGDTFRIYNDTSPVFDEDGNIVSDAPCLIEDPHNILGGEEVNHSFSGPGLVDWDSTSSPITINNSGTFTISEDGGSGATVTFRVTTGILFGDPSGGNGSGYENDVFTYEEVFLLEGTTLVGATLTISEIANLVNDEFMLDGGPRDAGGGLGSYLSPDNSSLEGFAEFTIAFHAAGDPSIPITLNNISVTIKDIDNEQYVAAENVDSYSLSATPPTELSARTVGTTLFVEELDGDGSRTEDEDHWAVLNFSSASTITMRLGSRDGDGALFNSLFAVAEWSSAPATIATGSISPPNPTPTPAVTTPVTTPAPAAVTPVAVATPTLATTGPSNLSNEILLGSSIALVALGVWLLGVRRRLRT
jgi:hypothetical protein